MTEDETAAKLAEMEFRCGQKFTGYFGAVEYKNREYYIDRDDLKEAEGMEGVKRVPVWLTSP